MDLDGYIVSEFYFYSCTLWKSVIFLGKCLIIKIICKFTMI